MRHFFTGNNAVSEVEFQAVRSHVLCCDYMLAEHALEHLSHPLWDIEDVMDKGRGRFLSRREIDGMLTNLSIFALELSTHVLTDNGRDEVERCCAAIRAIVDPGDDGKNVYYTMPNDKIPPAVDYVHPSGETAVNGVAAAAV